MAITKAEVDSIIMDRVGGFLAEVRRMTGDPAKPSPEPAIAWAVRKLGYSTGTLTKATDADLAGVPVTQADALFDLAEYRTLLSIQTNLTAVSNQTGPVRDEWNDLSARLAKIIPDKIKAIAAAHNIELDTVTQLRYVRMLAV